jgi:hypothetical protein
VHSAATMESGQVDPLVKQMDTKKVANWAATSDSRLVVDSAATMESGQVDPLVKQMDTEKVANWAATSDSRLAVH